MVFLFSIPASIIEKNNRLTEMIKRIIKKIRREVALVFAYSSLARMEQCMENYDKELKN